MAESAAMQPSRRRKTLIPVIILLGLLIAAALIALLLRRPRTIPILRAEAAQLKSTVLTPHLEEPIKPGKGVLWCSTFQLAWNETCKAAGGDIHLQNEPPMVAVLNKKSASISDVDAASCLVIAGSIQNGLVSRIENQMKLTFKGQVSPDLLRRIEGRLPSRGFAAYACLFRSLPFQHPFERLDEPLVFAGGARVVSFGFREGESRMDQLDLRKQVVVWDYKNDDDFIIAIWPEDPKECIILAKIQPADNLQKTVDLVRARIAASPGRQKDPTSEEPMAVPILNFDVTGEFPELYKTIITPGPLSNLPIVLALQSVRFRLDERGAVLESEALHAGTAFTGEIPRRFIFDKPFLILLERGDAERPYFALWVGSAELLAPF